MMFNPWGVDISNISKPEESIMITILLFMILIILMLIYSRKSKKK